MRTKADMHGYQDRTVTKLYESDAVQAVLPMGAGKTVCALTAIDEMIRDQVIRRAIVLAPKRVCQLVWPAEINGWAHLKGMTVRHVAGTPAEREKMLLKDQPADVYVVGIDNVKWLVAILEKLPEDHPLFDLLCIDELSRFKSPRSKLINKHLKKVRPRWKIVWGLTGTPRPNDYIDQFRPLQFLTDTKLFAPRSFDSWRLKNFMQVDGAGNPSEYGFKWQVRPEHEMKIIKKIASVTFTIDPSEMPELPELSTVIHWVDLPPSVMKQYKLMERELLANVDMKTILAPNSGVANGKLAQMAQGFIYGEGGNKEVTWLHAAKSDMLVDLVDAFDGEQALLVYGFLDDLRVMQELWPGIPFLGNGVSDKLAAQHEADWNAKKLDRLAMHPASAGHGLNLQHGGNQMIVFNMPWSAEQYDQMIKRFHRQGQIRRCFLHLILARNTVDEIKYDRVIGKMEDQAAFNKYLKRI